MEEVGLFAKVVPLGGSKGGIKVSCIKWDNLSKAKRVGGLRIKDLRLVNLALFSK